ncbi:hypothetical protein ACH5RR_006791 [Cinchona calisaya]|uniref:Uncharacterized protein n=1 Tax=Cinchona calisaya TaxID=153742 RepID=A0ABD3AQ11_9GENT
MKSVASTSEAPTKNQPKNTLLDDQTQKNQLEHVEHHSVPATVVEVVVERAATQPPPKQLIDTTNCPTNLETQILNPLDRELHQPDLLENTSLTEFQIQIY